MGGGALTGWLGLPEAGPWAGGAQAPRRGHLGAAATQSFTSSDFSQFSLEPGIRSVRTTHWVGPRSPSSQSAALGVPSTLALVEWGAEWGQAWGVEGTLQPKGRASVLSSPLTPSPGAGNLRGLCKGLWSRRIGLHSEEAPPLRDPSCPLRSDSRFPSPLPREGNLSPPPSILEGEVGGSGSSTRCSLPDGAGASRLRAAPSPLHPPRSHRIAIC